MDEKEEMMEERSFAVQNAPKAPTMNGVNNNNMGGGAVRPPQRPITPQQPQQQPPVRTAPPVQPINRSATPATAARTITDTISTIEKQAKKSYEELLEMEDKNIYELLEGELVNIKAPNVKHQMIVGELFGQVRAYAREKRYRVFVSPIDVRVDGADKEDKKIFNVFQPDLVLVKEIEKIDEYGIKGTPDIIMEVATEDTLIHDKLRKFRIYQKYGVKEYWIITPAERLIEKYILMDDKKYSVEIYYITDEIPSDICKGLKISLDEFMKENPDMFESILNTGKMANKKTRA